MRILKLLGEKKVPDELPDLATDDIEKRLSLEIESRPEQVKMFDIPQKQEPPKETITIIPAEEKKEVEKVPEKQIEVVNVPKEEIKLIMEDEMIKKPNDINKRPVVQLDNGFFTDMTKTLDKEMDDPKEFENWFNNRIKSRDVVTDMKEFYEKQKTSAILKVLGKKYKDKISEKTLELETLEKEWQEIYFKLVEKEEEIREKERSLKKVLQEFLEISKAKEKDDPKKKKDSIDSDRIIRIM